MDWKDNARVAGAALKRGEDADFEVAQLTYENTTPEGGAPMAEWCAEVSRSYGRPFGRDSGYVYKKAWGLYLAAEVVGGRQLARERTFKGEGGYYWEARDSSPSEEREAIQIREARAALNNPQTRRKVLKDLDDETLHDVDEDTYKEEKKRRPVEHQLIEAVAYPSPWSSVKFEREVYEHAFKSFWILDQLKDMSLPSEERQRLIFSLESSMKLEAKAISLLKEEDVAIAPDDLDAKAAIEAFESLLARP